MDCGREGRFFMSSLQVTWLDCWYLPTHVDCIGLRQEYLLSQNRFRSKTYLIYLFKKSTLFSSLQNFSKIQTDDNTRNPIQMNELYSLKSYLLYRATRFALKKAVIG